MLPFCNLLVINGLQRGPGRRSWLYGDFTVEFLRSDILITLEQLAVSNWQLAKSFVLRDLIAVFRRLLCVACLAVGFKIAPPSLANC